MKRKRAFTLIELLVVVAIIALLISILLPSLSRARELSKRLVCAANIKGIGTSFKIYANDNDESWPVAPHEGGSQIQYVHEWDGAGQLTFGPGAPQSGGSATEPSTDMESRDPVSRVLATKLTVTRSLFMLVRSGDVTPKQFVCPSSGDTADPTQNIDVYYDFGGEAEANRYGFAHISYGYQVPYGPFDTRPSENLDPRMAVAADKGPFSGLSGPGPIRQNSTITDSFTILQEPSNQDWMPFNSPNHGGQGAGEGQNVLFGDGHATFNKKPTVGIDRDNIFTKIDALDFWAGIRGGTNPQEFTDALNYYPGQDAWGTGNSATTDSLIYP